jgi:trk system potassium uptake protein TrkA
MNILICGAGEVGRHCAEVLAAAGHNITIIDRRRANIAALDDMLDVASLVGNATHGETLREAGIAETDTFIAATTDDVTNLMAGSIAKALGARKSIARVHHSVYFDRRGLDYADHFNIDHLVCPEYSTAVAIASTLRSPGALAVERFARGRIEMQSLPVSVNARAVGHKLKDLKLPGSARLASIERHSTVFLPDAESVIEPGDRVTIIGDNRQFDRVRRLFETDSSRRFRVVLMGGSSQSVWLCRALRHSNLSVRLFEPDETRAAELSEKLDWVTVMNADAIQTDALEEERLEQADVFAALTAEDERNILAAARAKTMGVRSAIAVLQRSTYLHLLEHVGIDRAFSPRSVAVSEIQRLLDVGPVRHLASLSERIAEVYEIEVPPTATTVVNKPLKDCEFPAHSLIAAIERGDEVFVPGADNRIQAGDTIIVIGPADVRKELRRMFTSKR